MGKVMVAFTALLAVMLAESVISGGDGCSKDIIAYYKFDYSYRDVCNGYNAINNYEKNDDIYLSNYGISAGGGIRLKNYAKLRVPSLNGYTWGSQFSVSLWFRYSGSGGLIDNGNNNDASWEIRITENFGNSNPFIRARIATTNSSKTWDIAMVYYDHWHHIVMTYDGKTVKFYLNNRLVKNDVKCCHGNIMTRHKDVVIGYGATGDNSNIIDEVFLFKKALTADQVKKLYQTLTFDEKTTSSLHQLNSSSSSVHSVSFLIVFLVLYFL